MLLSRALITKVERWLNHVTPLPPDGSVNGEKVEKGRPTLRIRLLFYIDCTSMIYRYYSSIDEGLPV